MILGLEGIHACGPIVFNDQSDSLPRVKLTGVPGLRTLPEFEPVTDPATGRIGEVPRVGTRGGKQFTYEGLLEGGGIVALNEKLAELGAAFADTGESRWDVYPSPSDPHEASLGARFFHARPLEFIPIESWPGRGRLGMRSHGFEYGFSLLVRMSDPRFYFPDEEEVTSGTRATNGGAGSIITPEGEDEGDASDQAITVDAPNSGNFATEGIITVSGQVTNPVISNQSTGKFLRFGGLEVDADESFTIDSKRRRIVRASGANIRDKLDAASTWWDRGVPFLRPGTNTIRLRGFTLGAAADLTVTYHSADIS